jgi:hypothetical protein
MTDFRTLCSELHDALEKRCETLEEDRLLDRSAAALRAALSQPEPVAPTDEEIAQFIAEWWGNMHGFAPHGDKTVYTVFEFVAREHFADFTRDVLARWGQP